MFATQRRPIILERAGGSEPCASCGARSFSVCDAIEDRDLARLASVAVPKELATGQALLEEGDPAEHFFNVTAGALKLYKGLSDGRRQITGFAYAGHFLGLAVSSTYAFSAEAIGPVRVCRFSRRELRVLLDEFPQLEKRLFEAASNELVAAQEQMLLLGRKTAVERVASFLLGAAGEDPCCTRAGVQLHLPMSRHDIADYLGLTIETVSRTFTRLKADHLIELPSPSEVVLLERSRLERIAEGLNQVAARVPGSAGSPAQGPKRGDIDPHQ